MQVIFERNKVESVLIFCKLVMALNEQKLH